MSKQISFSWPAGRAVRTAPTTPAAGPDRIASLPRNRPASTSPPLLCMKARLRGAIPLFFSPALNPAI